MNKFVFNTFEYLSCVVSSVLIIILSFIIGIFVFPGQSSAVDVILLLDLLAILFFLSLYKGIVEINVVNEEKIVIKWIRKPLFRKVVYTDLNIDNIIKVKIDKDYHLSYQTHLMCQIIGKDTYFLFYVSDNIELKRQLIKLCQVLQNIVDKKNKERIENTLLHVQFVVFW